MPPRATLRLMAEELAAKGWNADRIAGHIGMDREYARKVVNTVNRNEGGDLSRPTAEDHRQHVRAVLLQGGFAWWPPSLMARVYLAEKAPPTGRAFWRAG